jgi:hypothetical protein
MYFFVEVGLVITYGEIAWIDELNTPFAVVFDIFSILILIADIGVQLNSGYLFRGMIILDR